jgi:DNA adenine methylase
MAYNSPLRYPGGKGKLAPFIKQVYRKNNLPRTNYYEVFAGGAGIALDLLFSDLVTDLYLNDFNTAISSFWFAVINNTEDLCKRIHNTQISVDEWKFQKQIQYDPNYQQISNLDLAFSTFFLNRVNRSGIIKGGLIGGIDQNGKYKMDARFNRIELIRRIKLIADYKDQIHIYNLDGATFIRTVLIGMPNDGFVYLDPPYYRKGQKLYDNFFTHRDHEELANEVKNIRQHWIVSYDNVFEILELYSGRAVFDYELHYSAHMKYVGLEVMFCSDGLQFPIQEIQQNFHI